MLKIQVYINFQSSGERLILHITQIPLYTEVQKDPKVPDEQWGEPDEQRAM